MAEIITDSEERLTAWQRTNNMEVFNIKQISAIFMKQEDILKQLITLQNSNVKSLEERIKNLESKYEELDKKLFIVTKNIGVPTDKDFKNRFIRTLADELNEKSIFEQSL